jgi:signal transduction histidine kinase
VSVRVQDDEVRLVVEDDGAGVAEHQRDAVFERFVRGDGAVPGGSGLGLALVREGARASGGDATAGASDLGGLRVEVVWPLAHRPGA